MKVSTIARTLAAQFLYDAIDPASSSTKPDASFGREMTWDHTWFHS